MTFQFCLIFYFICLIYLPINFRLVHKREVILKRTNTILCYEYATANKLTDLLEFIKAETGKEHVIVDKCNRIYDSAITRKQ